MLVVFALFDLQPFDTPFEAGMTILSPSAEVKVQIAPEECEVLQSAIHDNYTSFFSH